YAVDVDGDGDVDVLSASAHDATIAWYQNDGNGNFGSQLVITSQASVAKSVYAADVDGDGDMDVLSASSGDNKIALYPNAFNDRPPLTTTTDGLGYYRFENVPAHPSYSVGPVVTQGWVRTSVIPPLELVPGGEVTNIDRGSDFDNANISGQIFRDLDVDGVRDAAEVGLEGWTVYIDADHDGVVSSSDPKTTTDSSGHYSFVDLGPFETYTINQLKPTGYVQTDPLAPAGISATLVRDHANSEDFQNLYDLSGTANGDFYFIGRDHGGSGYNSAELFHYSAETTLTQTLTNTNQPQAVTTDGSTAFWIDSDRNGNPVILKREAGGETTTVVYPRTSEDNQLTRPVDIEFLQHANDKDEFLVLDAEAGQLWLLKAGPLANELTKTGGARYASGNSRHHDSSLVVDGDTVYVADPGMEAFGDTPSAIESIPLSGSEWTTLYSGENAALAQGITIGRDKVIFSSGDNIYELAKNGGEPTLLVNDERFGSPAGLWFGSETLYAVDSLDLTQATSWEVSFNSATLATADKGWQITPGAGEHITNLGFGNIDTASLGGASGNSNISGRIYQ
ncbi:MAG: FG-GAP-like repeat-containing protein, partial [Pseudomonadales bacterium]|nr:FG-GAP-like repeat-containing protein [Pseudomonadales bacterium]